MKKIVLSFDQALEKISRLSLISCLLIILVLAVSSILLRWLGRSPLWIEPLVRHLVFLSTFLGGSLATSKRVHIKIDILTHLLEKRSSPLIRWFHQNLILVFSFIVTLILMWASWEFFQVEKEFGAESFLGIHSSLLVGVIPLGFGLISLRFFNQLLIGLLSHNSGVDFGAD